MVPKAWHEVEAQESSDDFFDSVEIGFFVLLLAVVLILGAPIWIPCWALGKVCQRWIR
jgi:K+-transporting ATPase A subunit